MQKSMRLKYEPSAVDPTGTLLVPEDELCERGLLGNNPNAPIDYSTRKPLKPLLALAPLCSGSYWSTART